MSELQKNKKNKKDKTIHIMVLGFFLVLGLIWTNTFIHQNSYFGGTGSFTFLNTFLLAAGITLGYYGIRKTGPEEPRRNTTKLCLLGTVISGILMLFAFFLELGTESFSLYSEKDIVLWWFSIPKRNIYDIWTILLFPTSISVIFKAMRKENFKLKALFYGMISILGLTLEGWLIFWSMNNIWLVDLIILNTITLAFAVWKYVFPAKQIRKGKAIVATTLYSVICMIFVLFMRMNGNGNFVSFMYGGDWSDLTNGINELVRNAAWFGTSDYLLKSEYIHEWLANQNKPILQLLYYGGRVSVIGFILYLMIFFIVLVKLLGIKNGRVHRNLLIFTTAAAMLSVRTIMGTLYGFGLLSYPIALPFLGSNGSYMDAMAFTLVLIGAGENYRINRFSKLNTTFVSAGDVLGIQEEYCIMDVWDDPYTEEIYEDEVRIIGKDVTIYCKTDWYMISSRSFCVFEEKSFETRKRFILEYADEKWKTVTDSNKDLSEQVIKKYLYSKKPNCISGGAGDEEYYVED